MTKTPDQAAGLPELPEPNPLMELCSCVTRPGRENLEDWKLVLRGLIERGLRRVMIVIHVCGLPSYVALECGNSYEDAPNRLIRLRGSQLDTFPRSNCTGHPEINGVYGHDIAFGVYALSQPLKNVVSTSVVPFLTVYNWPLFEFVSDLSFLRNPS